MSSASRFAARLGAAAALGLTITAAVWAFPAEADGPVVESSSAAMSPVAPEMSVPELGDGAAERSVAETDAIDESSAAAAAAEAALPASAPPVVAATPATPTEPDHLAPIADDTPEPEAVVTTTTTTVPPPTTAPPTPAATVAFTATQQYGSCGEAVPYDVFSGTATPGTAVSITSPYGSGSAVADAGGHWSTTVEFPTAPRGETFGVAVAGLGGSVSLSFTATGDHHG